MKCSSILKIVAIAPTQESWEKKFDERYGQSFERLNLRGYTIVVNFSNDLKHFISQLLQKATQEAVKAEHRRIKEWVEKNKKDNFDLSDIVFVDDLLNFLNK